MPFIYWKIEDGLKNQVRRWIKTEKVISALYTIIQHQLQSQRSLHFDSAVFKHAHVFFPF